MLSPVCSFYSWVNLTVHELLRVYGIGAYSMIYTMRMLCLMWNFRMMSTLLQDILVVIKNQNKIWQWLVLQGNVWLSFFFVGTLTSSDKLYVDHCSFLVPFFSFCSSVSLLRIQCPFIPVICDAPEVPWWLFDWKPGHIFSPCTLTKLRYILNILGYARLSLCMVH